LSVPTPETDLRNLWQSQETERTVMSLEQIQMKAREFLTKNRRDSIARFAFAVLASVFFVFAAMTTRRTTVRIAAISVMAMLLTNAAQRLYRAYKPRVDRITDEADSPWSSCVEFYRSELDKQRAFASPVWQMLAALLVIAWLVPDALHHSPDPFRISLPLVLFAAAGLLVLMAFRKFQARRVQRDIEALDSFERDNFPGGIDDSTIRE
jgi:hypothetical protein